MLLVIEQLPVAFIEKWQHTQISRAEGEYRRVSFPLVQYIDFGCERALIRFYVRSAHLNYDK